MEARLVYTSPEAVALGPSDLGTRARAFQPPKHKPTHILTPPPPIWHVFYHLGVKIPSF